MRRSGVRRQFYDGALFWQPESLRRRGIRQLQPHARMWSYDDRHGALVSRTGHVANQTTWNNGSCFEYAFEPRTEVIGSPFVIHPSVAIPAGRYDWIQHLLLYEGDHSRPFSGTMRATLGEFWSGTQKTYQISLLYRPTYRIVFDLGLQVSDIDLQLPDASFTTTLVNRTDVRQFSANVRFNLIHRPLSDFFIVYNESQFTDTTQTAGRGMVVKYTQMFAF